MNIRYQESSGTVAHDFAVRQRKPAPGQIAGIFAALFAITLLAFFIVHEKILFLSILLALFSALGWYIVMQIQFVQDQLMDAEFQNTLFSSSLSINHLFLAIVRHDNIVTYFNNGFQKTFPKFLKQPRRGIDVLLDQCEVKAEERDKILAAIMHCGSDQIVFDIYNDVGPQTVIVSVEPLGKPNGFVLFRGRKFVEVRKSLPSNSLPG